MWGKKVDCKRLARNAEYITFINLLKPCGNFTYHQDQNSNIRYGAHVAFVCFEWISE
jgi:hypothetical protein